jgi:hypothetical protein
METGPGPAARAREPELGFPLAPRARSVLPMHMRSGAEARSRRSLGARCSGPGFPGPGWNEWFPAALGFFPGREVAKPGSSLQRGADPATQAPVTPPPLLPVASRAAHAAWLPGPRDR